MGRTGTTRRRVGAGGGLALGLAGTLAGVVTGALVGSTPALAGAWPQPAGEALLIVKAEDEQASSNFDNDGDKVAMPHLRADSFTLYGEYGVTDRLTLVGKGGYTDGEDQTIRYSGRAPIALGLQYAVVTRPTWVVSLYLGGVVDGVGQNAGYALPKQGDYDLEVRILAGKSGQWRRRHVFGEVQLARFQRSGLPDETHVDATAGIDLTPKWLLLVQSYNGATDARSFGSDWSKLEASLVRRWGPWALQGGWRQTVWGKNDPITGGPVLAVWRRF